MLTNSPDQGTPGDVWPDAGLKVLRGNTAPRDKAAAPALTLLMVITGGLAGLNQHGLTYAGCMSVLPRR